MICPEGRGNPCWDCPRKRCIHWQAEPPEWVKEVAGLLGADPNEWNEEDE